MANRHDGRFSTANVGERVVAAFGGFDDVASGVFIFARGNWEFVTNVRDSLSGLQAFCCGGPLVELNSVTRLNFDGDARCLGSQVEWE